MKRLATAIVVAWPSLSGLRATPAEGADVPHAN